MIELTPAIEKLITSCTARLNAAKADSFGQRSVAEILEAGPHTIVLTLSDVRQRGFGRGVRRVQQFKVDGKITSVADVVEITGGCRSLDDNPVLRAAFEARAPQLAEDYRNLMTNVFNSLQQRHGKVLAYPDRNSNQSAFIAAMLRDVCDTVYFRGGQRLPKQASYWGTDEARLELNAAALQRVSIKYGIDTAAQWYTKTRAKLAGVQNPEVTRDTGMSGDLVVVGTLGDHKVCMVQNRIINCSPKGKLFHQFPALIYVDGRKYGEAQFRKEFVKAGASA